MEHQLNITKLALGTALILVWLSMWMSVSDLSYNENDISVYLHGGIQSPPKVAKAGFPFTVFYFPPAPLGNDIPDQGSFFPFALNTMIWFIVVFSVLNFIPKRFLTEKVQRSVFFFSFIVNLIGLFWVILEFD